VRQGRSRDHGVVVLAQAVDEAVQGGQVVGQDRVGPGIEILASTAGEDHGELADPLGGRRHRRATGDQVVEMAAMMLGQVLRFARQPGDQASRGGRDALGFGAALLR
jgi:hypothetical protein